MRSATPAGRRSGSGSSTTERLRRSRSVVTFAQPQSRAKISRSPSQWPKLARVATSAGRHAMPRPCGMRWPRGRRPCRAVPRRTPTPRPGQAQVELLRPTLWAIHVTVDRLVAQPLARFSVRPVQSEPAGDLLRRPARVQPIHHVGAQALVPRQLGPSAPPGEGLVLRRGRIVARHVAPAVAGIVAVTKTVAAQLAIDRRPVPDQASRNLGHAQARLNKPEQ